MDDIIIEKSLNELGQESRLLVFFISFFSLSQNS
jgi:hypothetical protein